MIVLNFIQILFKNLNHFLACSYFPTYKDEDNIFIIIIVISNFFDYKNSYLDYIS